MGRFHRVAPLLTLIATLVVGSTETALEVVHAASATLQESDPVRIVEPSADISPWAYEPKVVTVGVGQSIS